MPRYQIIYLGKYCTFHKRNKDQTTTAMFFKISETDLFRLGRRNCQEEQKLKFFRVAVQFKIGIISDFKTAILNGDKKII